MDKVPILGDLEKSIDDGFKKIMGDFKIAYPFLKGAFLLSSPSILVPYLIYKSIPAAFNGLTNKKAMELYKATGKTVGLGALKLGWNATKLTAKLGLEATKILGKYGKKAAIGLGAFGSKQAENITSHFNQKDMEKSIEKVNNVASTEDIEKNNKNDGVQDIIKINNIVDMQGIKDKDSAAIRTEFDYVNNRKIYILEDFESTATMWTPSEEELEARKKTKPFFTQEEITAKYGNLDGNELYRALAKDYDAIKEKEKLEFEKNSIKTIEPKEEIKQEVKVKAQEEPQINVKEEKEIAKHRLDDFPLTNQQYKKEQNLRLVSFLFDAGDAIEKITKAREEITGDKDKHNAYMEQYNAELIEKEAIVKEREAAREKERIRKEKGITIPEPFLDRLGSLHSWDENGNAIVTFAEPIPQAEFDKAEKDYMERRPKSIGETFNIKDVNKETKIKEISIKENIEDDFVDRVDFGEGCSFLFEKNKDGSYIQKFNINGNIGNGMEITEEHYKQVIRETAAANNSKDKEKEIEISSGLEM